MADFDAIVLGLGGMGSAALYHLARRGLRVLGLEQFHIAHDRGSSHGRTRIIRKSYFEHPAYVPLLHRAYELWTDLERITGRELFRPTGLLLSGPASGSIITGVERAAREHQLAIERMSAAEAGRRFDGFRFPPADTVLFEPDAGFLHVEACVQAHVDAARAAGAQILTDTPVESWIARSGEVRVRAGGVEYVAAALVIAAGAWAGRVLQDLSLPLEVRRKVVFWYPPTDEGCEVERRFPVFGFDTSAGFIYGMPAIDERGVKVALHSGGAVVTDPDALDRQCRSEDERPVLEFIRQYLPRLRPEKTHSSVCMYTMTPDEHFIVDRHPAHANVMIACGFSGHGFKFAPVIGSIAADLLIEGRTVEPVAFLSADRPGLHRGR